MNINKIISTTFIASMGLLISCNKGELKTNPNGMKYRFHTSTEGPKPKTGDILNMAMTYYTATDSLLLIPQKSMIPCSR